MSAHDWLLVTASAVMLIVGAVLSERAKKNLADARQHHDDAERVFGIVQRWMADNGHVAIGHRIRISVALIEIFKRDPNHWSELVELKEVRLEPDGTRTLVVESVRDDSDPKRCANLAYCHRKCASVTVCKNAEMHNADVQPQQGDGMSKIKSGLAGACLVVSASLSTPVLANAQPICVEIPHGRICAARPIKNAAETLARMPSTTNAAMRDLIDRVGHGPTAIVVDGTPGSNQWMPMPAPTPRTRLDGGPIGVPYPTFGPDIVVVDNGRPAEVIAGPQGAKGDKGDKGDVGARGPRGRTGATGPQGAQGVQGVKGDTGPQGVQGVQGPQGERGPRGRSAKKKDQQ